MPHWPHSKKGGIAMLNFCANPECGKPLHYLREGKVFLFHMPNGADGSEKTSGSPEHFWLCGECSKKKTLVQNAAGIVRAVEKLPTIIETGGRESYITGKAS
jgi:hypothetical protein